MSLQYPDLISFRYTSNQTAALHCSSSYNCFIVSPRILKISLLVCNDCIHQLGSWYVYITYLNYFYILLPLFPLSSLHFQGLLTFVKDLSPCVIIYFFAFYLYLGFIY